MTKTERIVGVLAILWCVVGALTLLLLAGKLYVTSLKRENLDAYNRLKLGMTESQVAEEFGAPIFEYTDHHYTPEWSQKLGFPEDSIGEGNYVTKVYYYDPYHVCDVVYSRSGKVIRVFGRAPYEPKYTVLQLFEDIE